ncbi:acyl transferase domain-containing protein [Hypoxylon fragiforme]|uniref:acyl transferase domain-containing protein n=1 Tax=Hypoxylon fragiforme TaxID=63214 RepID=UPI0020C602EC|nr:acyl transferase domain-containing protein [Hypoxylon fragiforme]KAI2604431.1 acyl transferase domain-containing protein [Hypoxylon fragiforme]
MDKKDASGESPSWRWEPWRKRDPRNAKVIEKTINKGYFIEDLENFDASFFGISPKEAEQMDPHQRLGLEVTWEALENAGLNPKSLSGSDTAVYMGCDSDDYSRLLLEDIPNIEPWMGIGTTAHGIPNRISYHFDLMGPSVAVDSACASSLCAVHFGRQAVLGGESRVAIVGGVNVCLSPALFHMLGSAGALSPDGVCLSFDDDAHGYARGEGAAVLILKRLSHAIKDGDRVLATLKGTAIAQDGKTNGIMAPNAKAQELVARKALQVADLDPLSIGYIEAHATSTSLGDPTEISAISAVYGAGRSPDAPAYVGSIKPNVGHLEAAAGAISLVKAVMAVNKGEIPPQARLQKLNTRVNWEKSGLQVVQEKTEWIEEGNRPRRAAVCSYGYGGTVSHAIIEQSPVAVPMAREEEDRPTLLLLSAPQEKRLAIQSAAQAEWLESSGKCESLKSVAATLARRRAHHDLRAAFVVGSHAEAAEAMNSFTKGTTGEWVSQGRAFETGISREAVWIFSGHGAQWADMGKELLENPVFRQTVAPLDEIVSRELGYSALDSLKRGDFQESDEIQVLTYLVQVGLSQLLQCQGIHPQAIIGHSVGEIAASVVAGCISPEEGTLIVTRRARLYARIRGFGGMYLVNLPFSEVSAELGDRKDIVAAIDSSPSSCVVSGAVAPLAQYTESLRERGIRTFQVKTDIAFHSPMLDILSTPLKDALSKALHPKLPSIRLYSTSMTDARALDPRDVDYWINNMLSPVWLTSAVNAAVEDGFRTFLEVSSHPIVLHSVNETLAEKDLKDFTTIATMRKNKSAEKSILHAVAQLYIKGATVDFNALFGRKWCGQVPGFRWSQKPYWKEVSSGSAGADMLHDVDLHTMTGQRTVVAGTDTILYTTTLNESNKPFPRPHKLHGTNIIPAAVYVNTFLHATGATTLSDMTLRIPLAVTDDPRNVQVVMEGENVKVASRLSSSDDHSWTVHSAAKWSDKPLTEAEPSIPIDAIRRRCNLLPNTYSIDHLTKVGVSGIAFPWAVTEHYGNDKEMIAKVDNDPDNKETTWDVKSWAPTLDAASSVGSTVFADDPKLRIVSQIDELVIHSRDPPPKVYFLYATETDAAAADPQTRSADVSILNVRGEVLAKFRGLRLTEVEGGSGISKGIDTLVHHMAWIPARLSEKPLLLKQAVIISSDTERYEQYAKDLSRQRHISKVVKVNTAKELQQAEISAMLNAMESAVVYCPEAVQPSDDIARASRKFIWEVASAVKFIAQNKLPVKFFIMTDRVFAAEDATALAQGALYGLARIVASEHPDIWGGLIDNEGPQFPILPFKYVQEQDIIRFEDGVPRIARLRPFSANQRHPASSTKTLLPKPEGTYVVTGGLGVLGLETCDFLIAKGARRIVILSRRALPRRSQWANASESIAPILARIQAMENHGASVHVVSLDVGAKNAHELLLDALDRLSLPPVLGVVHASGVLEDSLLVDTTEDSFARVLSPKISGALALHKAFPPGTLDFFVFYSSIGQLVGTSGQSSYGSGNAFLDTLAAHRRSLGCNAVAFQWTAWRSMGMGTSAFLTLELQSKGITDITCEEAFSAWEHLSKYDVEQAVVTRTLAYDEGESAPCPLMEEITVRRPRERDSSSSGAPAEGAKGESADRPTDTAELKKWLDIKIRESLASILKIGDIEDIDPRVALSDIGVDSVMTIVLRQKLQSVLKVKVPQTLTWNHPTVTAIIEYFVKQFQGEGSK